MELNPEQQQAVDHLEGPLAVYAGPGAGKTRVITSRCANLVNTGVAPHRILMVTFTRKASKEMQTRLTKLIGEKAKHIWCGTFHAQCSKLLRRVIQDDQRAGRTKDFLVFDSRHSHMAFRRALAECKIRVNEKEEQRLQNWVSEEKRTGEFASDVPPDSSEGELWHRYNAILEEQNAFDYDDLLTTTMLAAESDSSSGHAIRGMFDYVMIDEMQDTDPIQLRLAKAFASKRNICVIGDSDQSIYSWRGADITNLMEFKRHFPGATEIQLNENYRSTPNIVNFCNALIQKNKYRVDRVLRTSNKKGPDVRVIPCRDGQEESREVVKEIKKLLAHEVLKSEVAIVYRTRAQSRAFEEDLRRENIPYHVVKGHSFFDRTEIKETLSYLRLVSNPDSDFDFERAVNTPRRGYGKKKLDDLRFGAAQLGKSLYAASRGDKRLSSFHEPLDRANQSTDSPAKTAERLLNETGFFEHWKEKAAAGGEDGEDAQDRVNNIEEILTAVYQYEQREETPTLAGYLEELALSTPDDEESGNRVSLSTIHGCKGLEYDAVFVVGFERDVLPIRREGVNVEEERRLAFVACSRARKWLTLSYAKMRTTYNKTESRGQSPFLTELNTESSAPE